MESAANRLRTAIVAVAVCIVLAGCAYAVWTYLGLHKDTTSASPYYVSSSNTVLQVDTNASVHATEQRVYTVNEDTGCIVWGLSNMKDRQKLQMQSVKVSLLDDSGQLVRTEQLSKVPFSTLWRGSPQTLDTNCYAVDTAWQQLYVFSPYATGKVMITVDYVVKETVVPYRDVSEVLWTVVSGANDATTYDATLTVTLPVPADAADVSSSVYAWGHGPEGESVSVSEDGVITYTIPETQVWQYAELRFDFPTSWMTNLGTKYAQTYNNQLRMESLLVDEAKWSDSWHERSINSYTFDMSFIVLCLIMLVLSVVLYFRYGKPRLPDFTDEHFARPPWCDEPIHPVCVGRIWRWNRRRSLDLQAAVDYLVLKGAIDVSRPTMVGDTPTYTVRRKDLDGVLRPIDAATLAFLFDVVAEGSDELTSQQMRAFGEQKVTAYKDALADWQKVIDKQFDQDAYFERGGRRWQVRLLLLALLLAVVGIGMFALFNHPILLISSLVTAVTMALIANYLPRRTPLGNNVTTRAKALRNWIKDPAAAPEVSGSELAQVLPYACLLDLKDFALTRAEAYLPDEDFSDMAVLDDLDQTWQICYVTGLLKDLK